jgi:hypothetical protein
VSALYGSLLGGGNAVTIMIMISGITATMMCALIVLALSRVAARADEELDEIVARRIGATAARGQHESYAGWAFAQATMSCDPSITVPSSSSNVGTHRLPVSSCTSRRPRVRLSTPGSGASP